MKTNIYWNNETGKTVAKIYLNDGGVIEGRSYLHPEDKDLGGELVGATIASSRACLAAIKKEIAEHKARLTGIEHCLSILNQSNKTNINSYEYKTINRQALIEADYILQLRTRKKNIEEDLSIYIQEKDKYYKKIRANRQKSK